MKKKKKKEKEEKEMDDKKMKEVRESWPPLSPHHSDTHLVRPSGRRTGVEVLAITRYSPFTNCLAVTFQSCRVSQLVW